MTYSVAVSGASGYAGGEILRLLAAGQKDESVARALGVSVRTVQRKIQTLQRGFGAASRFQLGAISAKHLIVDRESAD